MIVQQPIFINGVGRSGSTLFHRLFAAHPHVAWLSRLTEQFPNKPFINRALMYWLDAPVLGKVLQTNVKPRESYSFWNRHYPGFGVSCRDLTADDVTIRLKQRLPQALVQTLTPRRNRLLIKITGWPRIGFLHEIFDDIKFISIVRDGRAVVNSMVNVDWWWGWRGPENWRWGQLTPAQHALWEDHDRSFLALAAIEWNTLMAADNWAREQFPAQNYMAIRYEDLCADPVRVCREAAAFCELAWTPQFEKYITRYPIANANSKWQAELTKAQQTCITDIMQEHLIAHKYLNAEEVPSPL